MIRKESKELREGGRKVAFQFKEIISFFLKWHIQLLTKYYIGLSFFHVSLIDHLRFQVS